jgi:oxygen-dependent protoporphyrinogen oxidase
LVDTIVGTLSGELLAEKTVIGLDLVPGAPAPYQVRLTDGQTRRADAVVMATPAFVAADLLEPHSHALAQKLRGIRYLSTATVSLVYKRDEFTHPLDGFGFVVPKSEHCRLMACTWVSTKFDHRTPANRVLLRVFVGGYKHEELADLPNETLLNLVKDELRSIMGVTAEPIRHEIYHWPRGNAQYDVGHLDRVAEIEALAAQTLPGLYLTGSAFRGVGLPDCIHQGEQTVGQLVEYLQQIRF